MHTHLFSNLSRVVKKVSYSKYCLFVYKWTVTWTKWVSSRYIKVFCSKNKHYALLIALQNCYRFLFSTDFYSFDPPSTADQCTRQLLISTFRQCFVLIVPVYFSRPCSWSLNPMLWFRSHWLTVECHLLANTTSKWNPTVNK